MDNIQTGYKNFTSLMQREFENVTKDAFFDVRKKAYDAVIAAGLPTRKTERYKYSSSEKLFRSEMHSNKKIEINDEVKNRIKNKKIDNAINIIFVDGNFVKELSDDTTHEGFVISSIAEKEESAVKLIAKENNVNDIFANMNTALFQDGLYITVDSEKKVERLIHIIYVVTKEDTLSCVRNIIDVADDAEITIAESIITVAEHKHSFTNIVVDIHARKNAQVNYYRLEDGGMHDNVVQNTHCYQDESSNINVNTITLSGNWIRNNVYSALAAEKGHINIHGLSVVDGSSHVDNHTYVDHISPECSSDQVYKGVWYDHAMGVFNGKIFVHKDAQKTNAMQYSQNILMNKGAKVNAKPELEIYADDVKCAHGSTNSKIDKQALFYLKSRGISEEKARALMLKAFIYDIIVTIEHPVWREYIEARVSLSS